MEGAALLLDSGVLPCEGDKAYRHPFVVMVLITWFEPLPPALVDSLTSLIVPPGLRLVIKLHKGGNCTQCSDSCSAVFRRYYLLCETNIQIE